MILELTFAAIAAVFVSAWVKYALMFRIGTAPPGSDAYVYLNRSNWFHRSRSVKAVENQQSMLLGSGVSVQPPLFWALGGFFSRETLFSRQWQPAVLFKLTLVFVTALLSGLLAWQLFDDFVGSAAFLSGVLYGASPINKNANPDNRYEFGYSPRGFAALLSATASASLICITVEPSNAVMWVVSALLLGAAMLTAKFCVQIVLLVFLPFGFISGSAEVLMVIMTGVMAAILLTGGRYLWSLRTQFGHLVYYARRLQWVRLRHQKSALASSSLFEFLRSLVLFERGIPDLIRHDLVIRGLVLYPLHIVCGCILLAAPEFVEQSPYLAATRDMWLITATVFLLISLPGLRFLGEADRYMEYVGFLPATVISVLFLLSGGFSDISLPIFAAIFIWYSIVSDLLPALPQQDTKERQELMDWVRENVSAALVIPIYHVQEIVFRAEVPCFYPLPLNNRRAELIVDYDVPSTDTEALKAEYGISHAIIDVKFLEHPRVKGAMADKECVFEIGETVIFKL